MRWLMIAPMIIIFTSGLALESCQKSQSDSHIKASVTAKESKLQLQKSLADYITYNNATELESSAELIIVGTTELSLENSKSTYISIKESTRRKVVLGESVLVTSPEGFLMNSYTVTPVKIQKVIKGNVKDEEVKVLQPAIVVRGPNQPAFIRTMADYSPLQKNSKYLLFLKEVDTKTYPNFAGVYGILSGSQGKFNFDKTDQEESLVESENEQYKKLKENVKKKYEAAVNLAL